MLLYYLLLLSSTACIVEGFAPLRKHHDQMQSPIDETDLLMQPEAGQQHHNLLYSANTESVCGVASLSCMAFGYISSIPIRCGVLNKVLVCERLDSATNKLKCDSFCDTDG